MTMIQIMGQVIYNHLFSDFKNKKIKELHLEVEKLRSDFITKKIKTFDKK